MINISQSKVSKMKMNSWVFNKFDLLSKLIASVRLLQCRHKGSFDAVRIHKDSWIKHRKQCITASQRDWVIIEACKIVQDQNTSRLLSGSVHWPASKRDSCAPLPPSRDRCDRWSASTARSWWCSCVLQWGVNMSMCSQRSHLHFYNMKEDSVAL